MPSHVNLSLTQVSQLMSSQWRGRPMAPMDACPSLMVGSPLSFRCLEEGESVSLPLWDPVNGSPRPARPIPSARNRAAAEPNSPLHLKESLEINIFSQDFFLFSLKLHDNGVFQAQGTQMASQKFP